MRRHFLAPIRVRVGNGGSAMSKSSDFDWASLDEQMKQFLPTSFGKKPVEKPKISKASFETTKRIDSKIIPVDPPTSDKAVDNESKSDTDKQADKESEDEEEIYDNEEETENLPVSHEIILKDHAHAVTAIALDPAGSRLISGGRDDYLKAWDFNGMDQTFKPFLTVEKAAGGTPVCDLQFTITGDQFLVCSGEMQGRIFDRDGNLKEETVKGDKYLRDLRNTKFAWN